MVDLIPQIAADALKRWDAGSTVFTLEMGGLGPGYEQCIHILIFEIVRDHLAEPIPNTMTDVQWSGFGKAAVARLDGLLGFSGAQVGQAKNLAFLYLRDGWSATLEKAKDRWIQVKRDFPVVPHA